ncbi:MAG: hypothetical protein ACOVOT_07125 [Rubrivivax sp.]|nr:hypothetical protein [Rubrivivax sp.]
MPHFQLSTAHRHRLAAAVLAVHAGVGVGVWRLEPWRERGAAIETRPPLTVALIALPQPGPDPASPAPATRRATLAVRAQQEPAIQVPGAALLLTAPALLEAPVLPSDNATAPLRPASQPLDLSLPRETLSGWRRRNPALDDPRSNSSRDSFEQRIAAALGGDDRIVEERLADGSVRFRRGASCVIARPNRAETLDPFNKAFSPKPRPVEAC